MSDFIPIIWISAIAGLATTLGSIFVLLLGHPDEKTLSALLAGAGGVMLAVVTVDLLPAAWKIGPLWQGIAGFTIGIGFMLEADRRFNSAPPSSVALSKHQRLKRVGLLVAAGIALHDLPEGMAIAVGQEAESSLGFLIALAITVHNLPEGMATATPLRMANVSKIKILLLNLVIAVFTPLGAVIGWFAVSLVKNSLAFFLALAAGAMAFLVFAELFPLSREKHPHYALLGGAVGFALFALISLVPH